ncbi:hypothetical protein ACFW04_003666 [Cataglyphis niger]
MLKLFLITLLCATLVFANSPVQKFQDVPMSGFRNTAEHFMDHGTSSLVRRSAYGSPSSSRPPGPPGPPGGMGGGMGGGMEGGMQGRVGGNAGGE